MLRRRRLLLFSLVALAGIVPAAPALAKTVPGSPPFRVVILDHMAGWQLRQFARHGAVGLLVPGTGPTTNRRQALAQLVRGVRENAYLGGVPSGPPLVSATAATGTPSRARTIIVTLPPKSDTPVQNDKRYYVVVLGGGFHGLLVSQTTRIPGLVSIVDIAPTALGHQRGSLTSTPAPHAIATLKTLNAQIHANNRLKLAALIILACLALLLAAVRPRAALTLVPAALLASIALGAAEVTNEVTILAVLIVVSVGGGLWLARVCRTDGRLLLLFLGVILLHLYLFAARPEWVALTPLGPTQNSRFWGIGNQLETLLLAPLLAGAAIAARKFGALGFAAFGVLGLFLMTDNRFGSDGGGAIVLGVALAFLGARMLRLGTRGFLMLLGIAAAIVLKVVSSNLSAAGPDHFRSAFGRGLSGSVGRGREPRAAVIPAGAAQLAVGDAARALVPHHVCGRALCRAPSPDARFRPHARPRNRRVAARQRLGHVRAHRRRRSARLARPVRTRTCGAGHRALARPRSAAARGCAGGGRSRGRLGREALCAPVREVAVDRDLGGQGRIEIDDVWRERRRAVRARLPERVERRVAGRAPLTKPRRADRAHEVVRLHFGQAHRAVRRPLDQMAAERPELHFAGMRVRERLGRAEQEVDDGADVGEPEAERGRQPHEPPVVDAPARVAVDAEAEAEPEHDRKEDEHVPDDRDGARVQCAVNRPER